MTAIRKLVFGSWRAPMEQVKSLDGAPGERRTEKICKKIK
jgi:hypothetical protein